MKKLYNAVVNIIAVIEFLIVFLVALIIIQIKGD